MEHTVAGLIERSIMAAIQKGVVKGAKQRRGGGSLSKTGAHHCLYFFVCDQRRGRVAGIAYSSSRMVYHHIVTQITAKPSYTQTIFKMIPKEILSSVGVLRLRLLSMEICLKKLITGISVIELRVKKKVYAVDFRNFSRLLD